MSTILVRMFHSLFVLFLLLLPVFSDSLELNLYTEDDGILQIYHHPRDREIVDRIYPLLTKDIESFQRNIGFYPEIQAQIVIASDRDYYRELVSNFSGIVEFSEAFYSPTEKRIYIRNLRDLRDITKLRKTLLHEYIHLFIDSTFRNTPLWFHEGMAVFFSDDLTFDRELRYARDYIFGNTLPLSEMRANYPKGRIQWESFYAKSALAVKYLHNNYREEFYTLWQYSEEPVDFSARFFEAFRMTELQFGRLVEESLNKRFRVEIILASTGVIWSILPLILFIAWLRKKWLNKRIKREWIDEETT